jgi:hypothetical protein
MKLREESRVNTRSKTLLVLWTRAHGAALMAALLMSTPRGVAQSQDVQSVCSRVTINLDQEAVFQRDTVRATLNLGNTHPAASIEELSVVLTIEDDAGGRAESKFFLPEPRLSGITNISGQGALPAGGSASIEWRLVPTAEAAPNTQTAYWVGGQLSYAIGSNRVVQPLFPACLFVLPSPSLRVDLFQERYVFGDDPFTDAGEPEVPFALGMVVKNRGAGPANDFRISSSQPKIVDNEKGLLVSFELVAAQVGAAPAAPEFSLVIGDLATNASEVAVWWMTCPLQGRFTNFLVTCAHDDELGGERTSLIEELETHDLVHVVRVDLPGDDGKPDFLARDGTDPAYLPEAIYGSSGEVYTVTSVTNAVTDGPVDSGHMAVAVTAGMPTGWGYLRIPDPGAGNYRLIGVVRSDGRVVRLGDNAWTTRRMEHVQASHPWQDPFVHLVDRDSTGQYTLYYAKPKVSMGVSDSRGSAQPADGLYTNDYGTVLTNSAMARYVDGGTQYVCAGWTMTGNEPAQGSSNSFVMIHTNDAELTWRWTTNYWLATGTNGPGTVNVTSDWHAAGSSVVVTAAPAAGALFAGWSGDTGGCTAAGTQIAVPMTKARDIQAVFNNPPVATNLVYTRGAGLALKIRIADLLAQSSDPDHDPLSLAGVGPSAQGATISTGRTHVFYVPINNNNDSFTYTVSDGRGGSDDGTITVNVVAVGGQARTGEPSGGGMTLHFAGIPGYTYLVQRATDVDGPWITLDTRVAPANGLFDFTDPDPPEPTAFYRLAGP